MGFLQNQLIKQVEKQVDVAYLVDKFLRWADSQIDGIDEEDDNDTAEKIRDYLRPHLFAGVEAYKKHVTEPEDADDG